MSLTAYIEAIARAGATEVYCDGQKVEAWAFNPNNVLSWEDSVGNMAWLLFLPLPEGSILMGNVLNREERAQSPSESKIPPLAKLARLFTPPEFMNIATLPISV